MQRLFVGSKQALQKILARPGRTLAFESCEPAGDASRGVDCLPLLLLFLDPSFVRGGGGPIGVTGAAGVVGLSSSPALLPSRQPGKSQKWLPPLSCHPIGCLPTRRVEGHGLSPSGVSEYLPPRTCFFACAGPELLEAELPSCVGREGPRGDERLATFLRAHVSGPPSSAVRHCDGDERCASAGRTEL